MGRTGTTFSSFSTGMASRLENAAACALLWIGLDYGCDESCGKMEHKDASIIEGIRREKNEEVGEGFFVRLLPHHSVDTLFIKKDGSRMILPHFYAEHARGDIALSDEYSEFQWVGLNELADFAPMIENVRWIGPLLQRAGLNATPNEFVEI